MYTKHVFDQQIGVKAPSNVTIQPYTYQYQILERKNK